MNSPKLTASNKTSARLEAINNRQVLRVAWREISHFLSDSIMHPPEGESARSFETRREKRPA